jgi:hypothetical protein
MGLMEEHNKQETFIGDPSPRPATPERDKTWWSCSIIGYIGHWLETGTFMAWDTLSILELILLKGGASQFKAVRKK